MSVEVAPDAPDSTRSLRAVHKHRTRSALRAAAIKLFTERGFDTTTTEEIAAEAGVSARTFFRYFPTKESVLYLGDRSWIEMLADYIIHQPRSLRQIDAVRGAMVELARKLPRSRDSVRVYGRIVAGSATLRGRELENHRANIETLADVLSRRRGLDRSDSASLLLASLSVFIYRQAIDAWLAGPEGAALAEIIADYFSQLERQFA